MVEGGQGGVRDLIGSPGQDYLSISTDSAHPEVAMTFLSDYICTTDYFRRLAEQGFVPPVPNAEDYLSDPLARKVAQVFNEAENVQFYWDQILPSTLAEAHKLLVHQLFELQLSPDQVAKGHEDLIRETSR